MTESAAECAGNVSLVAPDDSSFEHSLASPSTFYRGELDALRFCAFLAVFSFHALYHPPAYSAAHTPPWIFSIISSVLSAGSRGVDLFFVLSAYLITELLLREKEECGSLDVKSFYIRRILRIWPLYYLFVILAAVVPSLNPGGRFSLHYVIPFMLLAGNWGTIVFGPTGSVAEPLWSVSVEEQFYLGWAPIVARLSRRQICVAALIMIGLANIARVVEVGRQATGWQIWANSIAHLDSMAGGILVAVLLNGKMPRLGSRARWSLLLVALIVIVAWTYVGDKQIGVSVPGVLFGYPLIAASCTAVLVAVLGTSLRLDFLRYLGKISYGLYVYHLMFIRASNRFLPMRWGAAGIAIRALVALGCTIALSSLSYRFFEAPFLRLKRRFTYVTSRPV